MKADNSGQSPFDFLQTPLENATMVKNDLVLAESIGGVSLSMLINTGLWWGVCKMPGIIVALANKHQSIEPEKTSLYKVKADFCLQLAPLVALTETTLAGKISPWPLEPLWWRPIFWSYVVLSVYGGYRLNDNWQGIPVTVMAFLATEALSRTLGSATLTSMMKRAGIKNINDAYYKFGEYTILAITTGIVTASVAYQVLHYNNVNPVKVAFISAVVAVAASVLSASMSIANIDFNNPQVNAICVAEAAALALVGALIIVVSRAGAGDRARGVALAGALAGAVAVAVAGSGAGFESGVLFGAASKAEAVALAGVVAGALAGFGAINGINMLAQKKPALAISAAVVSATVFALVNSLSDYAVYGYPLEQALSETSRTLWKKLYAPLEYFSTLFQ